MRKNGFTIIEVVVAFLLILGVTFFVVPHSLNTTKQAKFISKWASLYSQMEYIFSAIHAQQGEEIEKRLFEAENNDMRTEIAVEVLKPYLRIKNGVEKDLYHQHYMNYKPVSVKDKYYLEDFYNTETGEIVGLKWVQKDCHGKGICGIIVFDVNGLKEPNTWGRDIFGINVFDHSIEPIGAGLGSNELRTDCSSFGRGLYCSKYYLIGGEFD